MVPVTQFLALLLPICAATTILPPSPPVPTTTTSTTAAFLQFSPVDGAVNRGCRGSSMHDVGPGYYDEHAGMTSLDACKTFCIYQPNCTGIEYSGNYDGGRCRVWTRQGGIEVTVALQDYVCLSFNTTLPGGTRCALWQRVEGDGSPEHTDRYKCGLVVPNDRRLLMV
mmetsp:Transcript_16604/g.29066  ORF Transcript_16604/g.29066 Transcript_16604/m.29066 type:complete len:168 (-) Transcript_16604:90-593(-)